METKAQKRQEPASTLYLEGYDAKGKKCTSFVGSSFDVGGDTNVMTAALSFKHAAERDGRALILTLVPRWKVPFLAVLGLHPWKVRAKGPHITADRAR
ncbi:MAG TPA: hypothetical protein VFN67_11610 [Polyangiales bacterium]|nr:hypothetical protein [Polyangiales bacterium]